MEPLSPKTSQRRRTRWSPVWVAALLGLGLVGGAWYASRSWRSAPATSSPGALPSAGTVAGGGGAVAPAAGRTVGPGVGGVLEAVQRWQREHPYYHLVIQSHGTFLSSKTEVFRFQNEQGQPVVRVGVEMAMPRAVTFWLQEEQGEARAYFPLSNQAVTLEPKEKLLAQLGWKVEQFDPKELPKLARAAFVETQGEVKAVTFDFSPESLLLPQGSGDLFLTLKVNAAGEIVEVEQLTLGQRSSSTLKFVSFDAPQVSRTAPTIPIARAQAAKKTFEQAFLEEANLTSTKQSTRI